MKKKIISFLMAAVLTTGLTSVVTNKIKDSADVNTAQVTVSNVGVFSSDEPDPW